MNPCPCGRERGSGCICNEHTIHNYWKRLSGPIMDRIDLWVSVNKIDYDKLSARNREPTSSAMIKERVEKARNVQRNRFSLHKSKKAFNSEMNSRDIEQMIEMEDVARTLLAASAKKLQISGRGFHRIIKVAQTIADLSGEKQINEAHIMEALQYRIRKN
jgi:magnesium chelatase family protein